MSPRQPSESRDSQPPASTSAAPAEPTLAAETSSAIEHVLPLPLVEQPDVSGQRRRGCSIVTLVKLAVVIALVLAIILGLTVGNLGEKIGDLFEWVDTHRAAGVFIFAALYIVVTALFFPSSILTLAGGAIFHFWGIPIVWLSACIGHTGSFFISRYLLRDWVSTWGSKYAIWNAVDAAIRDQALKVVILLRLATLLPYSVVNALLPITSVSFKDYTIGSAVGILPGVLLYVMIGRLASGIAEVANGDTRASPVVLITTIVVSIVVLIIVVVLLARYAKRALTAQADAERETASAAPSDALGGSPIAEAVAGSGASASRPCAGKVATGALEVVHESDTDGATDDAQGVEAAGGRRGAEQVSIGA